jgi:HPt (histidine-containing phosphotransfer) domain-containing protein
MGAPDLIQTARQLEQKIAQAKGPQRLALQPDLSRILERMKVSGQTVPENLRKLDNALRDEAVESWFDNMPV